MSKNSEKLLTLSKGAKSKWLENATERKKSEKWSARSIRIALNVLEVLRQKNMSKKELAERMQVSAQYISKIVKGRENLTLETISNIESALGVEMIDVKDFSPMVQVKNWCPLSQTKTFKSSPEQDSQYKGTPYNYSYAS